MLYWKLVEDATDKTGFKLVKITSKETRSLVEQGYRCHIGRVSHTYAKPEQWTKWNSGGK